MKFLKKFNEDLQDYDSDFDLENYHKYLDYDNLIIMSDNYLAYLKDDGYKIEYDENYDGDVYLELKKDDETDSEYNFSDVEDILSPFLIILSSKYDTLSIYIETTITNTSKTYDIDNLLNGVESPTNIESIFIYIYPQKKPS